MTVLGHVDRVSGEGLVFGWCLDDARPGVRLDVVLRADGVDIGTVQASGQRQDLRDAGHGDGRHGFIFALPIAVLRQRRACVITAFDAASGTGFGDSVVYRADTTATFDDRLTRIESDLATIRNRMQVSPSSDAAIATLFEAVGGFFARLGQDLRDGRPSVDGFGLAGGMDVLAATYADIRLPIVAAPRIAVFLHASADLDALHQRLRAIAATRMVGAADVFLLDAGLHPQAALLPGVARNLRYLRLGLDAVGSLDAILESMHHEMLVVLDGALPFEADWLDALVEHLAANPGVGIVGLAPVSLPEAGGPVTEAQRGGMPASARAVDAAGFALRAEALAMCEGLDDGFADLDGAVVDLCHRLRALGWSADCHAATPAMIATPGDPREPARRRSVALLHQRWPAALEGVAGQGIVALLLTQGIKADAVAEAVAAVRAAAHAPVVICLIARQDAEPALLRCHVQTLWAADVDAAAATLGRVGERLLMVGVSDPAIRARLAGLAPVVALEALADWLGDTAAGA